jgi:hypothetical protein
MPQAALARWPQAREFAVRTDIKWAGSIESRSESGQPGFAVGAPDCNSRSLFEGQFATFTNWRRASYDDLDQLLGTVVAGDTVTRDMLAASDVIAFEMNGSSPGFLGGWETVDVTFRDSQSEFTVHWVDQPGAPRDEHVIANGSISGDRYGAFFGIPPEQIIFGEPTLTPERVVVSFLLLKARGEIDVTGPAFRLTLRRPTGLAASPNPDALGVLLHSDAQPPRRIKPAKSSTIQVLDLCQKLRTEDAISPALAAVWKRRLSGQPPRGTFEAHIYDTFDRMTLDAHPLLEQGFARFAEFRELGTDTYFSVTGSLPSLPSGHWSRRSLPRSSCAPGLVWLRRRSPRPRRASRVLGCAAHGCPLGRRRPGCIRRNRLHTSPLCGTT